MRRNKMKKICVAFIFAVIILFEMPNSAGAVQAAASTSESVAPCSDKIGWKYKIINKKLYKILYLIFDYQHKYYAFKYFEI